MLGRASASSLATERSSIELLRQSPWLKYRRHIIIRSKGILMDLGLKNRVAIVAAASRGIGFGCARELAREGARVFLCSRRATAASDAAQKIHEETGADVAGFACDVTNDQDVQAFVNLVRERGGQI